MNQDKKEIKLFSDFAPISTKEWEEKIKIDLKGSDYEKKLFWKSPEGIKIKPFYRSEDIAELDYLQTLPNQYPYARGYKESNNDWLVRQDIFVGDIKKTNNKALEILMKGVTSLGFIFSDKYQAKVLDIETLMENIFADIVEVNFVIGTGSHKVISVYEGLVKKYNRDPKSIYGSVDFDPFSALLFKGRFCQTEAYAFEHAVQIIQAAEFLPNFKTLSINGLNIRNAGANIVEELAFSLAMGAEYLTRITDLGLSVDDIAPRIKFNFGVGSNYFMEIAKLRAARVLWSKIVNAYGPAKVETTKMHIHSTNTIFNKTIYDAHANLLRTTTETLSALLGGTDSFTVLPYNATSEWPTDFAERIARNQQLLLKEESFIDKISDPASGSYYVESLTNNIIDKAWELFLKIDEKGGYISSIKDGFIQDTIKQSAEERKSYAATRKEIYLGTNQFPNFTESIDQIINPDSLKTFDQTSPGAIVETVKQFRVSQGFENLRYTTDMYAKKNKRPLAFMLTIGHLNMRKARAQFACNFFAVAGFQVQDNNGFNNIGEGMQAAREANADIIVLCSSDDDYAKLGKEFAEKTKEIAVVAGYPKSIINDLNNYGLYKFIHVKSNLLEELSNYQKELGIV